MIFKFNFSLYSVLLVFLFLVEPVTTAQVPKGFNPELASELIRLCNSYTFLDLYDSDEEIIPEGYQLFYTSETKGLDNKFQVYLKDTLAVFNFRGSTADPYSWLENLHSAMIPSSGTIQIEDSYFQYSLAKDSSASVHGGYALGLSYIYEDIFEAIDSLNSLGYSKIMITGHSQGGALSNMLRALLENLPSDRFMLDNSYYTYAFAAPMIGDEDFVREYNHRYCRNGTSFNIVNPEDGVPKLPSSFDDSTKVIYNNIVMYLTDPFKINLLTFVKDASYLLIGEEVTDKIHKFGRSIVHEVSKEKGDVVLPIYTKEINYFYLGNVVYLSPVSYPTFENDSLLLINQSYRTSYSVWDNEKYFNKKNAKSEPGMFQHKPYNYYVGLLLRFFPERYESLERKFLPENL